MGTGIAAAALLLVACGAGQYLAASMSCAAGAGNSILAALDIATARAQGANSVFNGGVSHNEVTELQAWGTAYFNKVQTGSSGISGTFSFTTSAMNSDLFNPFYGPRQTLINLNNLSNSDCMKGIAKYGGTDPVILAKQKAIKDAVTSMEYTTDPVTNAWGNATHVGKILDASYVSNLVVFTDDGKLISKNLPLDVLEGAGVNPQFATTLSPDSVTALLALTELMPDLARNASGETEAQAMLSGNASRADSVADSVRTILDQVGTQANAVERMDAIFGVYGQLPLVYVALKDCAILIDTMTGAVTAPVLLGSPLDATYLLSAHTEATSPSSHRLVSKVAGCVALVAPSWNPTPPPGGPWTIPPSVAPTPTTPGIPTGGNGQYSCKAGPLGLCACERDIPMPTPAGGGPIPRCRQRCTFSGGVLCTPPNGCTSHNPLYPSGDCPAMPGCTAACTFEWYY